MPYLIALLTLLPLTLLAGNEKFAEEALKNILSYNETSPDAYFMKIKPFFTQEAFSEYQKSFETTNLPLINKLNLTMSGEVNDLKQLNNEQYSGNVAISFQGNNINLSQHLSLSITLTQSDGTEKIKTLSFEKTDEPSIKIKSYEEKVMCLKRKGINPEQQSDNSPAPNTLD